MMSAATAGSRNQRGKGGKRPPGRADEVVCSACGEDNKISARFCQGCGKSLTGGSWLNAQTLTVLGACLATLVALGALFSTVIDTGDTSGGSSAVTTPARTAPTPAGQPPDLSTMSPREAADRLFNRVMMADEQGNADEVTQFAPMAIAAYDQLESLDLDALYHVGLIHAAAGDLDSAGDAVERLKAAVPEHLLASLLEHRLAMDANDQARADRAIEQFRAHYDDEIRIDRLEYRDHERSIVQFREQYGMTANGG